MILDRFGHFRESIEMSLGPCSKFSFPTLSVFLNVRCCGRDDSKPAFASGFKPLNLVLGERTVGMALFVGHGSQDGAITDGPCSSLEHKGLQSGVHGLTSRPHSSSFPTTALISCIRVEGSQAGVI